MNPPLLRADAVSYAADGKAILSGVSFAMEEGEIRAVVGPNGAGKSTLVRCLAGVSAATAGRVEIAGFDQKSLSRRRLARSVCYIPQIQGAPPPFTVRDYVLMGRYAHTDFWRGLTSRDIDKTDRALDVAGVGHLAEQALPTLSGGERQLVDIAAGLAQEAFLLILDEPTTFLDPAHQKLLLDLIRRLNREQGISILVVTHDINLAMIFTDRTLALRAGRPVYDGPSRELGRAETLRDIYGMEFVFMATGRGGRMVVPAGLAEAWE